MARTRVVEDPSLTALYPNGIPTILEIKETSGRVRSARLDFPPGHHRNPLTDAQIDGKFMRMAQPVLGTRAGAALTALRSLDAETDLRRVTPLLTASP
jgi:2-methylcitrate dehydratase